VISLSGALTYLILLKGIKSAMKTLLFVLFCFISTAIINPLFSHEGMTILCYFESGNQPTLESIIYGLCAGTMLSSVMCHFFCFNEVMTSDKFIYLFGRIIPSLSLVLSMTFRFVPRFLSQLKVIVNAEKCLGRDVSKGTLLERVKSGLSILSAMITWALENGIETSDSMKARGYGQKGRTAFSIFTFEKRDKIALITLLFLGGIILTGSICGEMYFSTFPMIKFSEMSVFGICIFTSYFFLCYYPVILELWEVRRWKLLRSKI
jgi:energy-coupling factor transport system permease protein